MFRSLAPDFAVAPQLDLADIARAKAAGFRAIVNSRPDGEDPAAAQGAAIEAEARDAGLAYHYIPVSHAGFSAAQIDALDAARRDAGGPVLGYCRSGTRSAFLWALAEARGGRDPETLTRDAAAAGYDLTPVRPMLDALAGCAGA